MFLQFAGKEYTEKEILQKVKEIWTKNLKRKVGEMKDVKIYLKPKSQQHIMLSMAIQPEE